MRFAEALSQPLLFPTRGYRGLGVEYGCAPLAELHLQAFHQYSYLQI
jgi:hypothetical protein